MPRAIDLGVGARYRGYLLFHRFLDQGSNIEQAIRLMLDHYPTLRRDQELLDYLGN